MLEYLACTCLQKQACQSRDSGSSVAVVVCCRWYTVFQGVTVHSNARGDETCVLVQGKRKQARGVLLRILQIGAAIGVTVGLVVFGAKSAVPAIFTQNALVSAEVQRVLPVMALWMVSKESFLRRQCLNAFVLLSRLALPPFLCALPPFLRVGDWVT